MKYFNLTTQQKNIWNLQKFYGDTAIGNQCGAIFYKEKRDSTLLKLALHQFVKSQTGIRLRFTEMEEPVQYLSDEIKEIPMMTFETMEAYENYAKKFAKEPIGLVDNAMYRFVVFEVEDQSGILASLSHLISDAWTFSIMANQVDIAYHHLNEGRKCILVEADYTDYIQSEKNYFLSEKYKKDRLYWENEYEVEPEKYIIRGTSSETGSVKADRIINKLPIDLDQQIAKYCNLHSVTPAVLFETALISYLSKINIENDCITIGVLVLNRSNAKEKMMAGMFVSTMPLAVQIEECMTIIELAKQIKKRHMDIFRHQKYPYEDILKYLRKKQNYSGNLYQVLISYQNARTDIKAETEWYSNGFSEVPCAIHIDNRDGNSTHTITVDYQTDVFKDKREVAFLIQRLEYILYQIVFGEANIVKDINIVPYRETKKIVEGFNDTCVEYPTDKCVHELFMEQVRKTPDKIALVFEEKEFTYNQLDEMSNSLAHYLREKGVKRNDIVPIIAKRSWHVIVAMLGVLKAGGAYMPILPEFPSERIEYMFQTANVKMTLMYGNIQDSLCASRVDVVNLELFDYSTNTFPISNCNQIKDLCYIIFTSGSTGQPKGVSIKHENILNYCHNNDNNVCHKIISKENTSIISVTSIVFDIFVTESILSLLNGLTIYMANDEEVMSQSKISNLIKNNRIDIIQTTPTKMKSYVLDQTNVEYLSVLKTIILGGEPLTEELYKNLSDYSDAEIFNVYGPAETTVWSTILRVVSNDITIGSPIANTQIYILNKNQKPCPIGVAGELCIAGAGVGKGYLNRPELTAEKFVLNPFATEENRHGKIMYHTGDLACWRTDGEIEYLGRIDTQVKIRGLRIELGEIENVMSSFDGIGLTAVTDKCDENHRQYLVGYYTAQKEVDETELRHYLSSKLPKYMIPNYFMKLDSMPMTASGKTDRKNLPMPDISLQNREFVEPRTNTEKVLANIWKEFLHIEDIGREDDFFECGGDSLISISMLSEIEKRFDIAISMKNIMEQSVLKNLARYIDEAKQTIKIPANHKNTYYLLPQQKAIYAACSREPDLLLYNMPARIALSDHIDIEKLKNSIQKTVKHHKILMSHIESDGQNLIGVYDDTTDLFFETYKSDEIDMFVRPFDLSKSPLIRIGFTEKEMLLDMHHIVSDGETLNIILRDVLRAYKGINIFDEQITYGDYADFFYKQDMTEHERFFKAQLKCDFEPVVLPQTRHPIKKGRSKIYWISEETVYKAKKYAKKYNLTDTMLFWSAYGILLAKYSGNNSVLSSIVLKNRMYADTKDVAGMFANTLPVCLNVDGSVEEYARRMKQLLMGLFEHQEFPFASIADTVGMMDKGVINTSFVYQADGEKHIVLDGEVIAPKAIYTESAKFDLMMELTPCEIGMVVRMEFNCEKYDESLIDKLVDAYIRILEQLNKSNLSDIEVMSEEEYHKVVEEFNDTYVEYSIEKCVHELFMEQAAKTPDRVALVFEETKFTYKQLDEMSNSLAHYLREKGVKRNDVVPIIAKRSWCLIVSLLGILKAGGVYLPIATNYPEQRIKDIVEETKCKIVLSYGMKIYFTDKIQIWLDKFDYDSATDSIENVNVLEDSSYVIYTSGSTGKPKGIIQTHKCLYNLITWQIENLNPKNMNVLADTIISFDVSIQEMLYSLVGEGCLYFTNEEIKENTDCFLSYLKTNRIDILFTTPSYFRIVDQADIDNKIACVSNIFFAGEALSLEQNSWDKIKDYHISIWNQYGPAETHVVSNELIGKINGITIGSPIANTQIYILDKNQKPCPIGVAGELCIAGAGVGKGYLNRPELTAEKFVLNPFATEENRHGKIMYHTGDLACWRTDGEIEYLGRIDTQVKIRGLRIELGEIENVMSSFDGIGLTAVTDKCDENHRQYLVGYYTAQKEVDETALRHYLSSKLPKYMIPNYFMKLDSMPMTASGKTDRKNLPIPDMSLQSRKFVEPRTNQEKKLCVLLESLLHMEKVSVEDDFFAYGGDSLTAIEYVAKAHGMGIEFSLQNVFEYPTVRKLCVFLNGETEEKIHYHAVDFEKYHEVFAANVVDETVVLEKKSLGNVLLTGATGFLGAHVLAQLIEHENGKIYCLIRGDCIDQARKKISNILKYYFGNQLEMEINHRIIPIVGDIEKATLSEKMPTDVQTVIHTAASVKHYGSYTYFRTTNVEGTSNIVCYARSIGAKVIHISTVGVSGNSLADKFVKIRLKSETAFDETSLYIGQPLDNVYVHSKFEAERKVYDAILDGLDAIVIRVGNLTNRTSDYKFQPNYRENAFLTRVKAILEFGLFPDYLMSLYAEFSPVDQTAEGIVRIAQYANGQSVFHLNSNKVIYFHRFLEIVHQLGIKMNVVDGESFNRALQKTMNENSTEYIFEAFQNDMDDKGHLMYDSNIHIKNDFTLWFLKKVGFEWCETDMKYIKGYIDYFRELGYLEV